jgi:hypothetical protein
VTPGTKTHEKSISLIISSFLDKTENLPISTILSPETTIPPSSIISNLSSEIAPFKGSFDIVSI